MQKIPDNSRFFSGTFRRWRRLASILVIFLIICVNVGLIVNSHVRSEQIMLKRNWKSLQNSSSESQSLVARTHLSFRIKKEYGNSTRPQTDTTMEVSKVTSVKVAELNRTKEDVYKIHTDLWKRPDNYTDLPIPSFDARYLMNAKSCSDDNPPLYLIIVQTAPKHYLIRNVIRESWGNNHLLETQSIHVIFLLGEVVDNAHEIALQQEKELHGDLVQGAFIDSYRNLTHKSVLGLRWATEYCRQAKYVLRVDDDVFVNVFRLIELSEIKFGNKTRSIWCTVKEVSPVARERQSQWPIDENDFKGLEYYPMPYCNGPFSVITNDIIPELFEASKLTPFFWIEDTYVSGMLRYVADNISLNNLFDIVSYPKKRSFPMDCFLQEDKCNKVAFYPYETQDLWIIWINCLHQHRNITSNMYSNTTP